MTRKGKQKKRKTEDKMDGCSGQRDEMVGLGRIMEDDGRRWERTIDDAVRVITIHLCVDVSRYGPAIRMSNRDPSIAIPKTIQRT